MSVCADRDFLLYRLRLVLFQDPASQRFVSLPPADAFGYISTSLSQNFVSVGKGVDDVLTQNAPRSDSLLQRDPFAATGPAAGMEIPAPSPLIRRAATLTSSLPGTAGGPGGSGTTTGSPLVSRPTIRPSMSSGRRYAGTFVLPQGGVSTEELPSSTSGAVTSTEALPSTLNMSNNVTAEQTQQTTRFGTPQVSDLPVPHHSARLGSSTRTKKRSQSDPYRGRGSSIGSSPLGVTSDETTTNIAVSNSESLVSAPESDAAQNEILDNYFGSGVGAASALVYVHSAVGNEDDGRLLSPFPNTTGHRALSPVGEEVEYIQETPPESASSSSSTPQIKDQCSFNEGDDEAKEDDDELDNFRKSVVALRHSVRRGNQNSASSLLGDPTDRQTHLSPQVGTQPSLAPIEGMGSPEESPQPPPPHRQLQSQQTEDFLESSGVTTLDFAKVPLSVMIGTKDSQYNRRKSALRIQKKPAPPTATSTSSAQGTAQISSLKGVSALSKMVDSTDSGNPFARDFSFFDGQSGQKPLNLTLFLPFCTSQQSLSITIKREASVQDAIGFALFTYSNLSTRRPVIPSTHYDTSQWSLRIVEDDGSIDDDFPALDRARGIDKFGCDQFALCPSTPIVEETVVSSEDDKSPAGKGTIPQNSSRKSSIGSAFHPSQTAAAFESAGSSTPEPYMDSIPTVLVRVHVSSSTDARSVVSLQVPHHLTAKDLFLHICSKRKYDPKEYTLRLADGRTELLDVDKTLEKLKVTEFSIVPKMRRSAGDMLLAKDNAFFTQPTTVKFPAMSSNLAFKEYLVFYKHFMGKYERTLTIDGDYFHLVSAGTGGRAFFDRDPGKTATHHLSSIIFCKQSKRKRSLVKLQVKLERGYEVKAYELDAATPEEAEEICSRINAYSKKLQTIKA